MAIYFSFQAALCFSIAHILIRRGLVESNALTGSFISLSMSALVLWLALPFFAPLSALWDPAVLIFVAAGIFAPGIGRTLSYVGIERIGVARSVPIANCSPIFASILAVIFLAETWVLQNVIGTLLVIGGVILLSMAKPPQGEWRKFDVIYPLIGAVAFGASTNLRKAGLGFISMPLLAAAVTAHCGAVLTCPAAVSGRPVGVQTHAQKRGLALSRRGVQYRGHAVGFLRPQPWQSRHRRAAGQLESGDNAAPHGDISPRHRVANRAGDHRHGADRDRDNSRGAGALARKRRFNRSER
ncbi:MAG: DMT family transporter [Deltaproteobacteria bacterium]|nr:DMT family transporter [Deltaproteobacteria bacterium]